MFEGEVQHGSSQGTVRALVLVAEDVVGDECAVAPEARADADDEGVALPP